MGSPRQAEEMAWVLRLNSRDFRETNQATDCVVSQFREQRDRTCNKAAGNLQVAKSTATRSNTRFQLEEDANERTETLDVAGLDVEGLFDLAQKHFRPGGWKFWDAETSAALIDALAERGLEEDGRALELLLAHLGDVLMVVGEAGLVQLKQAVEARRALIGSHSGKPPRTEANLEFRMLALELYEAQPSKQAALVLSHGLAAEPDSWLPFCRPVTSTDVAASDPMAVSPAHLANWLVYLAARLPKDEVAKLEWLPHLIKHVDEDVRYRSLVLAAVSCHQAALREFATSPYSERQSGEGRSFLEKEYWRNHALMEFCHYAPSSVIREQMSPAHSALMLKKRPRGIPKLTDTSTNI